VIPEPSIYTGKLRHRRFGSPRHEFSYSLFMALLDIDRIPETMSRSLFSSYERFNWASFFERDHLGAARTTLRERLAADAAAHGVALPKGPVFLLTHLRYLGYCFNPISFFYFYDSTGGVPVVMAEVHNTFGESTNYWLGPGNREVAKRGMRFRVPKTLHVSPFLAMGLDYEFALTPPEGRLVAHMNVVDTASNGGSALFDATLMLERHDWTSGALLRALAAQPWMSAKVIAAIHWEALRLWIKGVPVFTHPDKAVQRL
jgi:hypothetical protein